MVTESLSPEDATLLCATSPEVQLQIGALCRFDGGPLRDGAGRLRADELRAHLAARLDRVPRFRQRVRALPFDLARPVWVDDDRFDIDRHVHVAGLPRPGGPAELRRFVADLLGRPLEPDRPLWDLWLVDGIEGGDVGLVLRVHHVVADGLSLLRAAMALLDPDPEPPAEPATGAWRPAPPPGAAALLVAGRLERRRNQAALAASAARALLDPGRVAGAVRSALRAATTPPATAPRMALTGRVGRRRDMVWASLPLGPLKDLAHARGVTLNDVVLTAVTGALRRYRGDGSTASGRRPRVLVPVGDAPGGDPGGGGNVFSFVVAGLPVEVADPARALRRVHREMGGRKASGQSTGMASLFSVVDVVPVPLLRRLAPGLLARQPFVNLAVTNLPGWDAPLYLRGARLRELHPIVTGVGNIACIVGVLSYCEELGVSITVDPDVVPDADRLLEALVREAERLVGDGP